MSPIEASTSVRLAHFSDLHVTLPSYRWQRGDWRNKRLTGWINLRLFGRGRRFRESRAVTEALTRDLAAQSPDLLVFTGDAGMLGLSEELQCVSELLGVSADGKPGIAVPGNHDYYVRESARGHFERHFAAWQTGRRIDDHAYPFARKTGHVWLIGACSARVNRWPWDATGHVDAAQLERLQQLVRDLDDGPRILVTHYPICMAKGRLENSAHRLANVLQVARVAEECGIGLWLHGHRHAPYHLPSTPFSKFPVICAGSATQRGRWSYGLYHITGNKLSAVRRAYDPERDCYADCETFELEIL